MRHFSRFALLITALIVIGAGCSKTPAAQNGTGHPVAPPDRPTQNPTIPQNAQNVPLPNPPAGY